MLVGSEVRRVAIVGGARIPFARAHGAYANVGNQDMLTAVFKGIVDKFGLKGARLGDAGAGAVLKHSKDWDMVRECVIGSGLSLETPGFDLQRACGTSLETAIIISSKIALGQIDSGLAGGVDTISDPPVVYSREYQQLLLRSFRGRTFGRRLDRSWACGHATSSPCFQASLSNAPGLAWGRAARSWPSSGRSAARIRTCCRSRVTSSAAAAYEAGFYNDLIIEYQGLKADNNVRRDTSLEKLAKLKPSFDLSAAGTLTAGNSSPLTDGAAAVLLGAEEWVRAHGLQARRTCVTEKSQQWTS